MNDYKSTRIKWDVEVESETVRLIERGYPPWQAIEKAVENISKQRREKCQQAGGDI